MSIRLVVSTQLTKRVGLTEFVVLVSGFQNAVGRGLWAEIFSNWSASGVISGVIWDVGRLPPLADRSL